jgi:hypothetical protein
MNAAVRLLRRIFFRVLHTEDRIEIRHFTWKEANALLAQNPDKPDEEKWHVASMPEVGLPRPIPDRIVGRVFLERRRRLRE